MKRFTKYFWLATYFIFVWLISASFIAWWSQKSISPNVGAEPVFERPFPYVKRDHVTERILPYATDERKSPNLPNQQTYLKMILSFPGLKFIYSTILALAIFCTSVRKIWDFATFIADKFRSFRSKRKKK
jgi:hypothetical protein